MSAADRQTKFNLCLNIVGDLSPQLRYQLKQLWEQERNWGSEGWQELKRLKDKLEKIEAEPPFPDPRLYHCADHGTSRCICPK